MQAQVERIERQLWEYRDRMLAAEREERWDVVRDLGRRAAIVEAELRRMLAVLRA